MALPLYREKPRRGWFLFVLLYCAVGIPLAWFNYSEGKLREALLARGKVTPATVQSLSRSSTGRSGSSRLRITYRYEDSNGREQKFTDTPSPAMPSSLKEGDTFEVTYLPEEPERHRPGRVDPAQHARYQSDALWGALAMGVGLVLMVLVGVFMPRLGQWTWVPGILVALNLGSWLGILVLTGLLLYSIRDWRHVRSLRHARK